MFLIVRHTSICKKTLRGPLTTRLRTLLFSALNCSSSHCCVFEPSSGHVRQTNFYLHVVKCFFSGTSRFCLTFRLTTQTEWLGSKWVTLLKISEIILMGHKTQIKDENNKKILLLLVTLLYHLEIWLVNSSQSSKTTWKDISKSKCKEESYIELPTSFSQVTKHLGNRKMHILHTVRSCMHG